MARKTKIQKQAALQGGLSAKNALDTALRLSDWDLLNTQASLNVANGYNNISLNVLSLQQILITYLYKTYGILSRIVDLPVDDAYRNGAFEIDAQTIDEDEVKLLYDACMMNDLQQVRLAQKWARLFGGAALVALDGEDLSKPLNKAALQKRGLRLVAVDRWQLTYSQPHIDMKDGTWQLTNYNQVTVNGNSDIDASRIFIIKGRPAPYLVSQQVQGWGISVFEQIFQDVSQLFKARNVLFEILDEAKTDVLKLAAMQTALSSAGGEAALMKMVDMIARNKNYKSTITLSKDDDYEQKQMSFSGIAEILKEIRIMIAGASNIPVNKIWGEGVTGFGSGEDSLENYNAQVENEVRTPANAIWDWIFELREYQLFGRKLDDVVKEWNPLRVMSAIDMQNIAEKEMNNGLQLYDRGLLTPQELMEYLKKKKIFVHDTKALNGELNDMPIGRSDDATS